VRGLFLIKDNCLNSLCDESAGFIGIVAGECVRMEGLINNVSAYYFSVVLFIALFVVGCNKMSEKESESSAGINGSFEVTKNDFPVNWLVYSPDTVPHADFKIILDQQKAKSGKQSLKFLVNECGSDGGWKSPGFSSEFSEEGKFFGKGRYKISYWVINHGAEFRISAGGVAAKGGNMQVLQQDSGLIDDWKFFQFEVDVAEDNWLKLELNILKPGTFWIDDIQIESI